MPLALTRKAGERITLGDNITIAVDWIRGNRVRLAIDAPGDIRVMREELLGTPTPPERVQRIRERMGTAAL